MFCLEQIFAGIKFCKWTFNHKSCKNLCPAKKNFAISKPHLIIMPGRRSKLFLMISTSSALVFFPVPYVSI